MSLTLRPYQKEAVKFFFYTIIRGGSGVVFEIDAGLGKTITSLTCYEFLRRKGANCLYVTRNALDTQVRDEAITHFNIRPIVHVGTREEILKNLAIVPMRSSELHIIRNTTLGERSLLKNKTLLRTIGQKFDLLIVDEVHDCKNPTALRSKVLMEIARVVPRRIVMSATIIGNSEKDVFVPYNIADPTVFGDSYRRFLDTYFSEIRIKNRTGKIQFTKHEVREYLREDLNKRLDSVRFVVRLDQANDIPPLIKNRILIEPSAEEKKIMDILQKEFCVLFEGGKQMTALSALEETIKLRQICSAVYKIQDQNGQASERFDENHSKVRWLLENLRELFNTTSGPILEKSPKVIIFTQFRSSCIGLSAVLRHAFKTKVACLLGGLSKDEFEKRKKEFQLDPNCHILVANIQVGGVGLNLQQASYMYFFSNSYSSIQDIQAQARAHRIGSNIHSHIVRNDLIMKGTIEESIYKSLDKKMSIIESIDQWRKEYGRKDNI